MTPEILTALGIDPKWAEPLQKTFDKYEINTPKRQAAFIGQCAHESNNFKTLQENLNYSVEGLMKTWPSRFPEDMIAKQFARNPEKIANKVYAGRMGNSQEGDGWAFRGRGLIQLTGHDNYAAFAVASGLDCVRKPDLILEPDNACLSAGWFWNKKGLNSLADIGDIVTITKRINGGTIGLDDRNTKVNKVLALLS